MAEGNGSDPIGLEDLAIASSESSDESSDSGDSSSDAEASSPDLDTLWPVQVRDVLRKPNGGQVPKPTKSHKKQPKEVQRTNKERRKERVKVRIEALDVITHQLL